MRTKHPELSPELIRRILPALRMMVRYPAKAAKVVSTETGIELAEIYAYTERHGRPKAKDLEQLERQATDEAPPPASIRLQPAPAKVAPPPALPAVPPPTPPADLWIGKRVDPAVVSRYLPIMDRMQAEPALSQTTACREAGLSHDTAFVQWKIKLLGPGRPDPATYQRFRAWAMSALGDLPLASAKAAPGAARPSAPGSETAGPTLPPAAPARRGPPATPRHSARNSDNCALARRLLAKAGACLAAANELLRDETDGLEDGGAE